VLAGVILGILGLLQADAAQGTEAAVIFTWTFGGGLIMGLILSSIARRLPASAFHHLLIWSVLLFANIGSVIIEGYFSVPGLVSNIWVVLAQQLLPCLVTAVLVYWLFAPRPYYEAQGSPLAVPDPRLTLQAEIIRAVLIVISLLPFLLTARMPIRQLALWSGLLLFIIGGIVPLTWQAGTLAVPLLLASAVEIFCQNFTTGVVAALLLAWPAGAIIAPRLRHT